MVSSHVHVNPSPAGMMPVGIFIGEAKMKKILFAAAALSALVAAPAMADTTTVTISGNIAPSCSGASEEATIALGDITGEDVGTLVANAAGPFEGVEVLCNGMNTKIKVTATPISNTTVEELPEGAAGAGFSRVINYTAAVSLESGYSSGLATGSASDSSASEGSDEEETLGLTKATFNLDLSEADAGGVLVAGDYEGSVSIEVTPAV
jgi:type 1 fimbria pilin